MSDLLGLLPFVVYIVGYIYTYRKIYPVLAEKSQRFNDSLTYTRLDSSEMAEERVMDAGLSMLIAVLWPFVLLGYGVYRTATPVTPGQRKAELDERERRIEAMEREAGIR